MGGWESGWVWVAGGGLNQSVDVIVGWKTGAERASSVLKITYIFYVFSIYVYFAFESKMEIVSFLCELQ